MGIDWSKAPEGAEYWCELQWFKTLDGEWRVWCPGVNSWVKPAYAAPDNFSWWGNAIKRPAAWTGEGLPPVGTVCEYYADEDTWRRCEILAHKDGKAVVWVNHVHIWSTSSGSGFRPIKTKEQIAAEEREKAIEDMVALVVKGQDYSVQAETGTSTADYVRNACKQLHDAGYRRSSHEH